MAYHKHKRGFSLIEVLIVAAVMLLFFGGLFLTIQQSLRLVADTRGRLTALTIATDYMEYVRSLAYDSVGTVSGIPTGLLPQQSTTTLNGLVFTRRVLIEYVDSPADGLGAADANSITTDYKQAKVEVSWVQQGVTKTEFLISNIVPRSIETNVGGGTIRVNVFDANVQPLPGVSVRLFNTTGTTSVDVTKSTDATGVALFGGAPAGANYEIVVTAAGYSTDQTHQATTSLPNPTTLPVTVIEADVTTMNFFVDQLGGLVIRTLASQTYDEATFAFASSSDVASSTNTTVTSGALQLSGSAGSYPSSGSAFLTMVSPLPLETWEQVNITASTTGATSYLVRVYSGTSTSTLIPDSDLPGNSSGFSASTIDISSLAAGTYPSLTFGFTLLSSDVNMTPRVHELIVSYLAEETPETGVSVTMTGNKSIGTRADTSPVYKTILTGNTGGTGSLEFAGVEWDSYRFVASGYDVANACPSEPMTIDPGATTTFDVVLSPNTANTLRVVVVNSSGDPIVGATVELERGSTDTLITSRCGQVFYSGLSGAADYELTVRAPGYSDFIVSPIDISSGDILQVVTLTP